MLPGAGTPTGKAVYIVLGVLVVLVSTCRLLRTATRGNGDTPYRVICTACGHQETRELPAGGGDLPLTCSECGEEAVLLSMKCPVCKEPFGYDPDDPPQTCPHCEADITKLWREGSQKR
ncbi:MAG: hypothetical protein ACOC8A_01665 [bacterium]